MKKVLDLEGNVVFQSESIQKCVDWIFWEASFDLFNYSIVNSENPDRITFLDKQKKAALSNYK